MLSVVSFDRAGFKIRSMDVMGPVSISSITIDNQSSLYHTPFGLLCHQA